jgi:CRP/FNR family transcriptional regulator, cyclic AMP receptor protein
MAVTKRARPFDVRKFLDSSGVARDIAQFRPNAVVYRQGDPADAVMYVQKGRVKLSVVSSAGKEAVVGVLGRGDFFGEGCLAGQPVRMGSVTAMTATTVLIIAKQKMVSLLHEQHALANVFIAYILARNIRIEEDLVDQLFNSSEKRLARILLLLAQYGKQDESQRIIPKVSQEVLAEMVGTTRSRVNFFMNKFRKLGFIEYNGGLKINNALMSVVLHD